MTLTTDIKKRVVIPGAAPGDVFACHQTADGILLQRIYRRSPQRRMTKKQALKAIGSWKALRGVKWEELRRMTREP